MLINSVFLMCASINILIGFLHLIIIFLGAPAYRYFGAGDWMVKKSEQKSYIPAIVTFLVASVFFVFAIYNLEISEIITLDFPWALEISIAITVVYLLRGSAVFFFVFIKRKISHFEKYSTYISLIVGLLHLYGVVLLLG